MSKAPDHKTKCQRRWVFASFLWYPIVLAYMIRNLDIPWSRFVNSEGVVWWILVGAFCSVPFIAATILFGFYLCSD